MTHKHTFHIVDQSPWPLIVSVSLMNFLLSSIIKIKNFNNNYYFMIISFLILILSISLWWRDIFRESTYQGHHTFHVYQGMKISMLLFILSEIMFFFSFFWGFFHFSLSPEMEISNHWPPQNIKMMNPYQIPLLNTIILLFSGMTITWSHFSIIFKKYLKTNFSLLLTIFLGLIFSVIQMCEYMITDFSINDNVFGSIFFMATGFHGLHVLIGTTFLIINYYRLMSSQFNNFHHFSFESAAWYWHFVDVVWIYLVISIYWWFFFFIKENMI